jgi:hypothetical protein
MEVLKMVELKFFDSINPDFDWDAALLKFSDSDYKQLSGYVFNSNKKIDNKTFRAALICDGEPKVLLQGSLIRLPFNSAFLLVRGGPVFNLHDNSNNSNNNLKVFLEELTAYFRTKFRFSYINIICNCEKLAAVELVFLESGFTRPLIERNPYITYLISPSPDQNLISMTVKWRNQLKKSFSYKHEFVFDSSEKGMADFVKLYNQMCALKELKSLRNDLLVLENLKLRLKDNFFIMLGKVDGEVVCGSIIIKCGDKAYYHMAGSNSLGRKYNSSNGMIWYLIKHLNIQGVSTLDLVGVDPTRNKGGYHFKKGIGGKAFSYLGEWEWSSHRFIKTIFSIYLTMKGWLR